MTAGDRTGTVLDEWADLARRLAWWDAVTTAAGEPPSWPPRTDGDVQIFNFGDIDYRIEPGPDGFTLVKVERDQRAGGPARFDRREDVTKYLVWTAAQYARQVLDLPNLRREWFRLGPDPRVTVVEEGRQRVLALPGVPGSSCTLGEVVAVSFSHVLPLTVDELEAELRAGVPAPPPGRAGA